jgi:signal transduction histidine kinase
MFAVDLGVVSLLVWLYLDSPDATQWVLFMIVQLEGAYRWSMRGAMGTAAWAGTFYAVVRYAASRRFGFEFTIDSITYVVGLTIVQGLVVGGMARRWRDETRATLQLHEAALALNAGLEDRSEVLAVVAREAARLVGAEFAVLWVPDDGAFVPAGASGLETDAEAYRLPASDPVFGESTVGAAFRTGEAAWAPDPRGRIERPALEVSILPPTWRSVCAVPVVNEGNTLGVLACYLHASHTGPEDAARLDALAALAAAAISNTDAYERERHALESLRSLDALKDDFLSTVSHELRTPLTVVEGFAATLRSRWDDLPDEQRRDLVRRIEAQSQELHDRIRDLLDFSRLRKGGSGIRPETLDVARLATETTNRLEPSLGAHHVNVTIPPETEAWIDPTAFGTILENLLVNAARYSPPDAPIEVHAAPEGEGWLEVSVVDRGYGVPPDEQERIFERFYRGRQPEVRRQRGTGIGLAIVKELAGAMGGSVRVTSSSDRGSTFTVRLPAGPDVVPDLVDDLGGTAPAAGHTDA